MTSRTIYLFRHGEPSIVLGDKRYIGQTDVELNEEGFRQARRWQPFFRNISLAKVLCSDLKRSLQTAETIVKEHPLPITPLSDLREVNMGAWEGLRFDEVSEKYPEEFTLRGIDPVNHQPPGGESFLDLKSRVVRCLEKTLSRTTGNVLIVGHAGVNRVFLCHLLGMPLGNLFRVGQNYAALNIITNRASEYQVQGVNLSAELKLINSK